MLFNKPDPLKLKAERNVYGLINVLKDSDFHVRAVAAQALGDIKDEIASEFLIEALEDSDWSVRRNASWALGEIGSKRAIPHLIHALGEVCGGIEAYACRGAGQDWTCFNNAAHKGISEPEFKHPLLVG